MWSNGAMRRRTWISVACVAVGAAVLTGVNLADANAATAGGLPVCKHFSDVKPPNRPPGPSHDSKSKGPKVSLSGRLPKLKLPRSSAASTPARPRPRVGKPGPATSVRQPRDDRK